MKPIRRVKQKSQRAFLKYSPQFRNREEIILRDFLAMERTKLANERTLLSYIRASLYLIIGGVALIQVQGLGSLHWLGYFSLLVSAIFAIIGIFRYHILNEKLKRFYKQNNKQQTRFDDRKSDDLE